MVRTGIAMYGLAPGNDDPFKDDLRPAMKLCSYVAGVRVVAPGDSVGYGRRFVADEPTRIGIVPIGYADGVRRLLTNRGDVLVAGRRCRITGTVSMDQLTVRLPDDWGAPATRSSSSARRETASTAAPAWRGRRLPLPGATAPTRHASCARRWRGCSRPSTTRSSATCRRGCVRRYRGAGPAA